MTTPASSWRASGRSVRARVLARDVSVTRVPPEQTSVVNVLPVLLESLQADRSTALLRLRVGGGEPEPADAAAGCTPVVHAPTWLLARITRKSCETLALQPGDALYAQIKGVALMQAPAPAPTGRTV